VFRLITKEGSKIPSCKVLQELGDYAGFVFMDPAMVKNWHQPIQCIGSSKGDGVVFKHRATIEFVPPPSSASCGGCKITEQKDWYPTQSPFEMSKLVAEHSASIPDARSITYTPSERWKFSADMERGGDPRIRMCMGSRKSSTSGPVDGPPPLSAAQGVVGVVPDWILKGFANAVHRVTDGRQLFTAGNLQVLTKPVRGPFLCQHGSVDPAHGHFFRVQGCPCIVSAALDRRVKIHEKNKSCMWIYEHTSSSKKRKRVLVFLKCLDPECRQRVQRVADDAFDSNGWGMLDEQGMRNVIDATCFL